MSELIAMNNKRFKVCIDGNNGVGLFDNSAKLLFIKFSNKEDALSCKDSLKHHCNLMNGLHDENERLKQKVDFYKYFQKDARELEKENERLRLELETHKHPLWSTREAERKLSEAINNLANEIKKNGLLNEEINQLRIENMRLKKKCGDSV